MSTDAGLTRAAGRARTASGRGRRTGSEGPQLYDFRRPTKLSREHVRTLQIVFETFARQWTTQLTSALRAVAQVNLASVEQLTYDEYVSSLSNPSFVNVISLDPIPGSGILEFSLSNAMLSVDHMLGGPGADHQPERPLSEIEGGLLRTLVNRVLGELRYAFEAIVKTEPKVTAVEYNPQFAQAASAADVMIVATFDMRVGSNESLATVCLPFGDMFPLLEAALGHGMTTERERLAHISARRALESGLETVPVEVSVRFNPTSVTPRTMVELSIGDVIPLRHGVAAPLTVSAAGVTFAHAVPGAHGRRMAALVVPAPADNGPDDANSARRQGA